MTEASATPRISAIVSTLGDGAGLPRLLDSLSAQTLPLHELIVVDQNDDPAAVAQALAAPQEFRVQHVHTPGERGLSRGRNRGVARCSGDVVVFPDDDCWYPSDFLARAVSLLRAHGAQFVCGRAADETGRTINGRFETTRQAVTRANVWTTSIEWMQVFKTDAVAAVGGYDEQVGIGASTPWHSAEGQEMVLRILAAGKRGLYDPALIGHHEELRIHRPDRQLRLKLRRYARGMGHVLRKHGYGPRESLKWVVRPVGGVGLSLLQLNLPRAALYGNVALGRIEGYLGRVKPDASQPAARRQAAGLIHEAARRTGRRHGEAVGTANRIGAWQSEVAMGSAGLRDPGPSPGAQIERDGSGPAV